MKLVKTIAAVGAVALLVPAAGQAQQPTQAPRQNLQLSEQQREQLRAFDEQHRTAAETTRRELGDLHRQLEEELTAAQPNSGRINQLRGSIVQKETALATQRLDRMAKLSSLLSAEQRQALRGRGLGSILRGGPRGFGRGGQMIRGERGGPRGQAGPRGQIGPRREMRGDPQRGPMMQRRGPVQAPRLRGGAGADADLRAEMRRLEAQLEALRRRIR